MMNFLTKMLNDVVFLLEDPVAAGRAGIKLLDAPRTGLIRASSVTPVHGRATCISRAQTHQTNVPSN